LAPISHVSSFSHHRGGIGALSGPGRVGAGAQKVVRSSLSLERIAKATWDDDQILLCG